MKKVHSSHNFIFYSSTKETDASMCRSLFTYLSSQVRISREKKKERKKKGFIADKAGLDYE